MRGGLGPDGGIIFDSWFGDGFLWLIGGVGLAHLRLRALARAAAAGSPQEAASTTSTRSRSRPPAARQHSPAGRRARRLGRARIDERGGGEHRPSLQPQQGRRQGREDAPRDRDLAALRRAELDRSLPAELDRDRPGSRLGRGRCGDGRKRRPHGRTLRRPSRDHRGLAWDSPRPAAATSSAGSTPPRRAASRRRGRGPRRSCRRA